MNFKPTLAKILVSLIVIVLWFGLLINERTNFCSTAEVVCGFECSSGSLGFSLLPDCCGCGASAQKLLEQFFSIIFPGVLIYAFWSVVEKKK